jgi:hypothetical protein
MPFIVGDAQPPRFCVPDNHAVSFGISPRDSLVVVRLSWYCSQPSSPLIDKVDALLRRLSIYGMRAWPSTAARRFE